MKYDPIMCMMVDDSVKTQDELSLSQKKQVVTELNGYLKKSYNFSDESEYARAYEDLRHMFTTGSRKSISGLFENAVKKTGSHDSVKAKDAKSYGKYKLPNGEIVEVIDRKNVHGADTIVYKNSRGVHFATVDWFMSNAKKVRDSKTIDKAIRSCDEAIKTADDSTGHKVVVFVENYLRSIGKNNSTGKYDKIVQGVRSLLSQSLLDDEGLKKAAEHEADRLLKKYNL